MTFQQGLSFSVAVQTAADRQVKNGVLSKSSQFFAVKEIITDVGLLLKVNVFLFILFKYHLSNEMTNNAQHR